MSGTSKDKLDASSDTEGVQPPFDPKPELESQRQDIDRILDTVTSLQGDMDFIKESINNIEARQPGSFVPPVNYAEEIDLLTENVSKFSKGLSEVEGLKFDIKMMQQRLKRIEELRFLTRTSVPTAEPLQEPVRNSTPMAAVKPSPQPTPRNHTGLFGESLLTNPDPRSRNPSRAFSEVPSGGHPLRNEHQVSDDYDNMDEYPEPPGDFRPSGRHMKIDTTSDNVYIGISQTQDSVLTEMPPPRIPYPPLDPRLSDAPQSSTNGSVESLPRPALTAHAAQHRDHPVLMPGTQQAATMPRYSPEESTANEVEPVDVVQPQPQSLAPQAQIVANHNKCRHSRTSVPVHLPTLGGQSPSGIGTEARTTQNQSKRRRTTAFDEAIPSSISSPAPTISAEGADARPSPSLSGLQRNEEGLLVKTNGKVDGRSMRYLSQAKEKRIHRPTQGPRDAEGYLLRPDGTRDARSVRIIDAAKRKRAEAMQAVHAALNGHPLA